MHLDLLGIRVDNFSGEEIEEWVREFLKKENLSQIITVNPEFIITAQKDEEFKSVINNADLNVADGIGIKFAFWRFGENLKKRITGVDLMWNILRIAEEENMPVFLLANESGLSSWQETAEVIKRKYPKLRVRGANMGQAVCYFDSKKKKNICNMKKYKILFSNFGAPEQDKFIASLKNYDNELRLAMGVGGSFDFISGKIKRAPRWMRKIGLEWLWRFSIEPRYRAKRIFKAVIIFPIRILFNR